MTKSTKSTVDIEDSTQEIENTDNSNSYKKSEITARKISKKSIPKKKPLSKKKTSKKIVTASENLKKSNSDDENSTPSDSRLSRQEYQKKKRELYRERKEKEKEERLSALNNAPPIECEGIVEISSKGFGFLRKKDINFLQSDSDVFVTPDTVREYNLKNGLLIEGISKKGLRGPQLVEIKSINNKDPNHILNLPFFEELTPINPNEKITLETERSKYTTRLIDLITPIGKGQRGLIVAPPRAGKTTLLHDITQSLITNYEKEIYPIIMLIDERPEEVTDFKMSFPYLEIFSSSNDSNSKEHIRVSLLAIERAKRLAENGEDVFILMDSITRLARAFNSNMKTSKDRGTATGGLTIGALEIPRKIFAAARNTKEAGSITIIATTLVQTNSKADEAIFQEFKGTGNMEIVLDREIAQNYVYPAVDIFKSGTRREELLLSDHVLEKVQIIRRGLSNSRPLSAMEWLLKCMEKYPSNAQMLIDLKTSVLH